MERWLAPQADNAGDVAGLLLTGTAPGGATATRLVAADDLWSHPFRVFGFPAAHDQGVWVSGRLRGRQAAGWVQMDGVAATGYRVEPGFSGTPVWDDELDGVVGMAVAAEARPEVRAAYLVPTSALVGAWPGLADQARPPCPYRGLFAFRERDATLFFGREEASDRLLGELTGHPLVAVAGPSGSGKSSLVFAGVVPRLRSARTGWWCRCARPRPPRPSPPWRRRSSRCWTRRCPRPGGSRSWPRWRRCSPRGGCRRSWTGRQLLATSGDGVTLQRFDAPWAARHLCAILGRDLTRQEWDDRVRGRAYQPACS